MLILGRLFDSVFANATHERRGYTHRVEYPPRGDDTVSNTCRPERGTVSNARHVRLTVSNSRRSRPQNHQNDSSAAQAERAYKKNSTRLGWALAVIVFVYNLVHSCLKGREAGPDPWDGWTLEWSTPSTPPPYNFATEPVVRGRRPLWDLKHPDDSDEPIEAGATVL